MIPTIFSYFSHRKYSRVCVHKTTVYMFTNLQLIFIKLLKGLDNRLMLHSTRHKVTGMLIERHSSDLVGNSSKTKSKHSSTNRYTVRK